MEKKDIKNKAASKKAVSNKREVQVFGKPSKEEKEFKIKKEHSIFIKGDTVYLTKVIEGIFKEQGII